MSPVSLYARASDWMPVPWLIAEIHGGAPPSKAKKYSQAVNVLRDEARASIASSSVRSGVHVWSPLELHVVQAALALPKFASGWSRRPWPGEDLNSSGDPANVTRVPAAGAADSGQNSVLRRRVSSTAFSRLAVSVPV